MAIGNQVYDIALPDKSFRAGRDMSGFSLVKEDLNGIHVEGFSGNVGYNQSKFGKMPLHRLNRDKLAKLVASKGIDPDDFLRMNNSDPGLEALLGEHVADGHALFTHTRSRFEGPSRLDSRTVFVQYPIAHN
jgi:hypothetical protein